MGNHKPFCVHFRVKPNRSSSYKQIFFRVRVLGGSTTDCGTGIFIEEDQWQPYWRQNIQPSFKRVEKVETKLDAIRDKLEQIYRYQLKRAELDGWRVTGKTIVRQFRGLPPIVRLQPINACKFHWKSIHSSLNGPRVNP